MTQVYFRDGENLRQIAVDTDDVQWAQYAVWEHLQYSTNGGYRGAVLAVVK